MTVAEATREYDAARVAYERAAENLRVTLELEAARLLGGVPPAILAVVHAVSAEFGVGIGSLLGRTRREEFTLPRHAVYALASEITGQSHSIVGRYLHRDDATIRWSVRVVRDLCQQDARYAARVARVRAALNAEAQGIHHKAA